jgi:hypothetical protein
MELHVIRPENRPDRLIQLCLHLIRAFIAKHSLICLYLISNYFFSSWSNLKNKINIVHPTRAHTAREPL